MTLTSMVEEEKAEGFVLANKHIIKELVLVEMNDIYTQAEPDEYTERIIIYRKSPLAKKLIKELSRRILTMRDPPEFLKD